MHWVLASALLIAGGCDRLFGLERDAPPLPADATIDMVDAPPLAGHDEDGDEVDDNLDVCPNIPDPDQDDVDDDGVGDQCDPRPQTKGDRRHYFSPLSDFNGWTRVTGVWTPMVDAVRSEQGTGNQLAYLGGPPVMNPSVIAVIAEPRSLGVAGLYGVVVATAEPLIGFPPCVACYVLAVNGDIYFYDNRVKAQAVFSPYDPALPVAISMTYLPDCRGRDAAGKIGSPAMDTIPVGFGWPSLYTYEGGATFTSVFVVSSGEER